MPSEIILSVCRDVRRMPLIGHTSRKDKSAEALRKTVMAQGRFGRRCYYCDFSFGSSDDYELSHLDGDHTNTAVDNVVPSCELCHCALHLDLLSRKWPGALGKIIFLPELSQAELNNLLQAVFFAMAMQVADEKGSVGSSGIHPHTIYIRLQDRARQLEQNDMGEDIRPNLSNPFVFGRVLIDMKDDEYEKRADLLAGCRYLPAAEYFIDRAKTWNANGAAFSALDFAAWKGIAGLTE